LDIRHEIDSRLVAEDFFDAAVEADSGDQGEAVLVVGEAAEVQELGLLDVGAVDVVL